MQDTGFILELINQPAWKKFITNHSINTPDKACEYIENKLIAMYQTLGFGLWVVELRAESRPIGVCVLLKRETLESVDLGFGFLSGVWGKDMHMRHLLPAWVMHIVHWRYPMF